MSFKEEESIMPIKAEKTGIEETVLKKENMTFAYIPRAMLHLVFPHNIAKKPLKKRVEKI